MKKTVKIILYTLLALVGLPVMFLVFSQVWFYVSTPVYSFREPQPFVGENFYNPYTNAAEGKWRKSIFHMHTKSWLGLTHGDSEWHELVDVYRNALGYEVTAVSNYMKVDTTGSHSPDYIPCYEHGYGYGKSHQLAMGNHKRILWRDYVFIQNIHQKQYVINLLRKRCEVLALNHPDLRYGYTPEDFKYLCGYDIFEVLNGARHSFAHWDSALTNGHTAWLTANDDSHGVKNMADVQRDVVFIHSPTTHREDILQNLRHGNAFGVNFPKMEAPTLEQKREAATLVTLPKYITLANDTLKVAWNEVMSDITFISDSGKVVASATNTDNATYAMQRTNRYVRVVLTSPTGLTYYLNPMVRSVDGNEPPKQELSSIDMGRTINKYQVIVLSVLAVLIGGFWIYRKTRK